MKKISKFKHWLIRKLGGEVLLSVQPQVIEKVCPTLTFRSRVELTIEEVGYLAKSFPKTADREIKRDLWQKLGDEVMPLMYVSKQVNKDNNTIVYKATLTIVKEDLEK